MERWRDRVAVVTGASSGIGEATLKDLVNAELTVVGLSRRPSRVLQVQQKLPQEIRCRVHALKCDVRDEEDVRKAFDWIDQNLGGTDILVNCAGVFDFGSLTSEDSMQIIKDTLDTQVMGVVFCTREAFRSMRSRNFDGHIVIINAIDGHQVPLFIGSDFPSFNIFAASKFAVTAMTETYRQEFANAGTKIKITSVSPGIVCTELGNNIVSNFDIPSLNVHNVSNAILYCIGTPPHVQIHELTIKPLGECM